MTVGWESSVYHPPLNTGDGRQRDIFPLPFLTDSGPLQHRVSRGTAKRVMKRVAVTRRVNLAINALNSLWFGGEHKYKTFQVDDISRLPIAQQDSLRSLIQRVKQMGPAPSSACRQEALNALLGASSSYMEPEPGVGDTVDMVLDRLSLPSGGVAGVTLLDQLCEPVRNMVDDFENFMLQDSSLWTDIQNETSRVPPYNDKLLSSRKGYLSFVKHLFNHGVLSFTSTVRGRVGSFCVAKKPKFVEGKKIHRQRLVLDCRQTNMMFKDPPLTELGSLPALGQMSLQPGQSLYTAGADIKDCFYAVNCPTGMCDFFCLVSDLTWDEALLVTGGKISQDFQHRRIVPCIKVLPMGFNWSFFLIQSMHESATLKALDISRHSLVLDGQPPPRLQEGKCISMPYCDNVHSMATDPKICQDGCNSICKDLEGMGFQLHEETTADTFCKTLGGVIDGELGQVRPTNERMWKIISGFEHLLSAKVGPLTVQKLLGHAMTLCVLNRSGMAVFRRLYDFVEHTAQPRHLNRLEKQEVANYIGIIPLLFSDMRRPWSQTLTATDASPTGYGVCEREISAQQSQSLGEWSERWRFKRLPPHLWNPRERTVGRDVFADPFTSRGVLGEADEIDMYVDNEEFPEVPQRLLYPPDWITAKMGKWRDTNEHITIKEGRALVLALRRLSRTRRHRGCNHVILLDNLSLVFAVTKGRAHSFDLLRLMQQIGSISLAADLGVHPRWIPSEWNLADGPSRGQISPGAFEKVCGEHCNHEQHLSVSEKEQFEKQRVEISQANGETSGAFEKSGTLSDVGAGSWQFKKNEEDSQIRAEFPRPASRGGKIGSARQTHTPGEEEHLERKPFTVRPIPREVQGFLQAERGPMAFGRRSGRWGHGRLHGRDVCRRPCSTRRRENFSRSRVQFDPSSWKNATLQESSQGLEESYAINKPSSVAEGGNVRHRHDSFRKRGAYDVFDGFGGLLSLSSSRRSNRPSRKACHPSSKAGWKAVCHDHGNHQGPGGSEARQGGSVRQFPTVRPCTHPVDRRTTTLQSKGTQQKGRSNFLLQSRAVSGTVCSGCKCHRIGEASSLSNETWRGDRRFDRKTSRLQWCKDKRQVVHRPKREALCQGGQSPTADQQDQRQQHEILPLVREKHSESFPRRDSSTNTDQLIDDVFSLTSRPHRFALEVFAGSARITQAFRKEDLPAYAIDTCLFPSHNVLLPSVENKIRFWIESKRIFFIWLGMPCTTFSKARKNDGLGPGPLRSPEFLWGLPHLKRRDVAKVEDGNLLLAFLIRILYLCIQHSVPFVVENPLSSMLWDMPPMVRFRNNYHPQMIYLDYCAYGECWKKPTTLMSHGIDLAPLAKRCTTTSKICSFTNRQHLALRGVNADGIFWTLVAQPYPQSLCAELAALARAQLRVVKGS